MQSLGEIYPEVVGFPGLSGKPLTFPAVTLRSSSPRHEAEGAFLSARPWAARGRGPGSC